MSRRSPPRSRKNQKLNRLRVTQKNLVYAINLPESIAEESILSQPNYFGQYGPIRKIVVKPRSNSRSQKLFSAYITYKDIISASYCVLSLDGFLIENNHVKASYGMTKYCTFFINGQVCLNEDCVFLHRLPKKSGKRSGYDYDFISKLTHRDIENIILDFSRKTIQESEKYLAKMQKKIRSGDAGKGLPSPIPIMKRLKKREPRKFGVYKKAEIKSVHYGHDGSRENGIRSSWHTTHNQKKNYWDDSQTGKSKFLF